MFRTSVARSLLVVVATCMLLSLALLAPSPATVQATPSATTRAAAVWGQADFVSVDRHCNHPSSMNLCGPTQVVPDDQGDLWVTDLVDNRVLLFPPGSAIASKVFGQYGAMITHGCDQAPPKGSSYPAAPNRYTLCQPAGLTIDHRGTLYVADSL